MKEFIHSIALDNPKVFSDHNVAWIDIETDGLSHQNRIALIGLILIPKGACEGQLVQLFNDDGASEKSVLKKLLEWISKYQIDYFVSFNGNAFDFPFINARLKRWGFKETLSKAFNVDLLQIIRKHKKELPLEHLNLKNIERFLGIHRLDTISGKESVAYYLAFLESNEEDLLNQILQHNYDDLVNMLPLLLIFNHISSDLKDHLNPLMRLADVNWVLSEYQLKGDRLYTNWVPFCANQLKPFHIHEAGYQMSCNHEALHITLLTTSIIDKALYVVDTMAIYGLSFDTFSNDEKQSFLIYNKGYFYLNHIKNHAQYLLSKTYKKES